MSHEIEDGEEIIKDFDKNLDDHYINSSPLKIGEAKYERSIIFRFFDQYESTYAID